MLYITGINPRFCGVNAGLNGSTLPIIYCISSVYSKSGRNNGCSGLAKLHHGDPAWCSLYSITSRCLRVDTLWKTPFSCCSDAG